VNAGSAKLSIDYGEKTPKQCNWQTKIKLLVSKMLAPSCCNVSATIDDPKRHPLEPRLWHRINDLQKTNQGEGKDSSQNCTLTRRDEHPQRQHRISHKINPRCPSNGGWLNWWTGCTLSNRFVSQQRQHYRSKNVSTPQRSCCHRPIVTGDVANSSKYCACVPPHKAHRQNRQYEIMLKTQKFKNTRRNS